MGEFFFNKLEKCNELLSAKHPITKTFFLDKINVLISDINTITLRKATKSWISDDLRSTSPNKKHLNEKENECPTANIPY